MDKQEKLILNEDGTWSQQVTLTRNIGRQDDALYRVMTAGNLVKDPVFIGKRGTVKVYAGESAAGIYVLAVTQTLNLSACFLQLNTNGRISLRPWNRGAADTSNPDMLMVNPITVATPGFIVFALSLDDTRLSAKESPKAYIVQYDKIGILPLPNIWPDGKICEGNDAIGLAGKYDNIMDAAVNTVTAFCTRTTNNHLTDGSDLSRNVIEVQNDGTLTMVPAVCHSSALAEEELPKRIIKLLQG